MEQTNSTNTASGAHGMMDRVRESATSQLSSQKNRATDGLGSLAQAVRQSTETLRNNQQDTIAQYVEQAADGIEQFASRLRDRDVNELMRDARTFARRQPALFIGVAFAAGVVAARFLKSSGDNGGAFGNDERQDFARYGGAGIGAAGSTSGYGSTTPRLATGGL